MKRQTFVRWAGNRFFVLQVAYYKPAPEAATEYFLTRMGGTLPSGTVETFFRSAFNFNDFMSFANREDRLKNGGVFSKDEAQKELNRWRKRREMQGMTTELEFANDNVTARSKHAFRLLGTRKYGEAFHYLMKNAAHELSHEECLVLVKQRFDMHSDREVIEAYQYWHDHPQEFGRY